MNKRMMVATIVIVIAAQMPPTTAQLYTLQANAGPEPATAEMPSTPPAPQIEAVMPLPWHARSPRR